LARILLRKKKAAQKFSIFIFFGGKDSFKYCENGGSVSVRAELLTSRDYQRVVASDPILKWNYTGKILSQEEKQKVLQTFVDYFDQCKIKRVFSEEIENLSS
jgi:hypothetical protein